MTQSTSPMIGRQPVLCLREALVSLLVELVECVRQLDGLLAEVQRQHVVGLALMTLVQHLPLCNHQTERFIRSLCCLCGSLTHLLDHLGRWCGGLALLFSSLRLGHLLQSLCLSPALSLHTNDNLQRVQRQ